MTITDIRFATLDQRECAYALDCVNRVKKDPMASREYYTFVKRMPAMIVTCGLGQSIAFLLADKGNKMLLKDISKWLTEEQGIYQPSKDLIDSMMKGDLTSYISAQEMTLRLLFWIRKLLSAFIQEEEP